LLISIQLFSLIWLKLDVYWVLFVVGDLYH